MPDVQKNRLTKQKKPSFKPKAQPGFKPGPLGQNAVVLPLASPPIPLAVCYVFARFKCLVHNLRGFSEHWVLGEKREFSPPPICVLCYNGGGHQSR